MKNLQYMEQCYNYNLYDIEPIKRKEEYIGLNKIIGGNELRSSMYYENWSPVFTDNRYDSLYEKIKNLKNTEERRRFLKNTHKINPIDIYCFKNKGKDECFVLSDGHRRISLSKLFNINKIYAEITYYNLESKC